MSKELVEIAVARTLQDFLMTRLFEINDTIDRETFKLITETTVIIVKDYEFALTWNNANDVDYIHNVDMSFKFENTDKEPAALICEWLEHVYSENVVEIREIIFGKRTEVFRPKVDKVGIQTIGEKNVFTGKVVPNK